MTLEELLEKLKSGNCLSGFRLYLDYNNIGDRGAQALAEALASGHCPSGLEIYLRYSMIGNEGAQALAKALASGHCPPGLYINLDANDFDKIGVQALAGALASGKCPSGLKLILTGIWVGDEGAQAIAEALASGQCPLGLQLDLGESKIGAIGENKIREKGFQALAEALNSGHCRFGTMICLNNKKYYFKGLSEKNNESIGQAALGIAIVIGGFSHHNKQPTSRLMTMLPEAIVNHIAGFLPGHISANKIAAYLKKSFINLMKTNMEFSQKHRSNNSVNQHLYDKQHGLSLWKCNEHRRKNWLKNHPIMIQRQMPVHSTR